MMLKIKKIYSASIKFFHFARKHRIKTRPEDWWKGFLLLLFGWFLIAINIVTFRYALNSPLLTVNFFIQFFSGLGFLYVLIFTLHLLKKKDFSAHKFLSISKENERPGSGILSVNERKILILIRGFTAVISYIGLELAKIAIGSVDNSIIFSADALMYAILAMLLLHERYSFLEWVGIFLAVLGISIIGFFDIFAESPFLGISGGILGTTSSTFMAIVFIVTSVIVQHDYPIRVAFYQCLCGLIVSSIVLLTLLPWLKFNVNEIFSVGFLTQSTQQGVFYSLALLCFFRAFYYVNPIIVAISSYSLDIFTILLQYIIYQENISLKDFSSSIIISVGIGILLFAEHRKNKNESKNEH